MTLEFENGETVIYDAVIASDGVHSPVRDWMLGAEEARFDRLPIARRFRRS